MAKVIEITVGPDGAVDIDAQGFKGADCEKATKAFEDALGGAVTSKKLKPEYRQAVGAREKQ